MIQKIGSLVLSFPIGLGRGMVILLSSLHSILKIIFGQYTHDVRKVIVQRTSLQIYFTGVQTLPLLISIGVFFAAALMGAGYLNLRSLGAENHFGELLRIGVLGELGPLLAGLIVSARSGTAITADIGSMKIRGELDILLSHKISVATYLVLPRLIGVWLSTLILSILFVATIYVSCWMIAPPLGLQFTEVFAITKQSLQVSDLTVLCIKSSVFGIAIPMITIHHGFKVARNTQDLPRVGSQAVVACLSIIFLLDAMVSIFVWI